MVSQDPTTTPAAAGVDADRQRDGDRDGNRDRDRQLAESRSDVAAQFVELIETEFRAMAVSTAAFIIIGLVLWVPGMLLIATFGMVAGLFRQLARIPAKQGRLQLAVIMFAGGQWATTLFVVAVLPIALPVMVFNLVGPVTLAATYLDEREHRPLLVAAVAVAGVMGILGLTQEGMRMEEGVADWIVEWTTIGFLVGYTWMFIATIRDANRTRVQTLDQALAANDRLVRTRDQLRRSRRRLVEVADQERGRIERNIHDGAQQRLVSAAVQLRLASQLAERGQTPDVETLDLLHEEITGALSELRELAQGIYPSLLVERGLVDAVASLGRRASIPATVEGSVGIALTGEVQAGIYFFCAEALQNAAKHAGPDAAVAIGFSGDDSDELRVTVSDTGVGFDPTIVANSRGMLNMVDRIEALDGTLHIDSGPGRGTRLEAAVPLGAEVGLP